MILLLCVGGSGTVWPEIGIKNSPTFPKMDQDEAITVLT